MPIAYPVLNKIARVFLSEEELTSLFYHDIFEYPLTMAELVKWSAGKKALISDRSIKANTRNGYFYLNGREGLVLKRLMRKRISSRKLEIANEAVKVFSLIPTIKLVAVTGALSMENASDESDIDLLIVTKKGTLWTTRLWVYITLRSFHFALRKPKDKVQKDKLCLNMWLDESDLAWYAKTRNTYTAHEIAQIRPLVNKANTYEKFISENKWVRDYWPNAVKMTEQTEGSNKRSTILPKFIERLAFWLQYRYMKSKITREIVTPTRALFHPVDWGQFVLQKLSS